MDRGAGRVEGGNPGKNPGSASDARKYRKAKNNEIRERWTKPLDQDVEAEMRLAEGKQRSGLERQRLMEMLACQTLRWAEPWRQGESEARSYFEKGNQAEGKGRQTQRQTGKYMEPGKERRPGAKEVGSPIAGVPIPCPCTPGLPAE